MPDNSNKLSQFWLELKRRKVIKVIAMYAGVAYIIIELVNNVTEPLHLPGWTATLVILLLVIGFPITAILSWIFDMTPDGLKKTIHEETAREETSGSFKRRLKVSDGIIAVLIVIILILVYPKIFRSSNIEDIRSKGKISLAVMPFQNLTNDTTWNVWQPGIQNNLITHLSNYSDELIVRQIESVNYLAESEGLTNIASITPAKGSKISRKLGADVFISGSITSDLASIRINAQLIHSTSKEVFKSFQIDVPRESSLNFQVIDELTAQVKDYLLLSQKQQEVPDLQLSLVSTNDPEAYIYYVKGKNAFAEKDFNQSAQFLSEAIKIDTNFTFAAILLSWAYVNTGEYDKAKEAHQIAYRRRESLPAHLRTKMMDQHAYIYEGPEARIIYLKQLPQYDDQDPFNYYDLGGVYLRLEEYHKAITQFHKVLEIYKKWGTKPFWVNNYTDLGFAYHQTGQYRKERRIYRKAERDFPDHPDLIRRKAIFFLHTNNNRKANNYLEKYNEVLNYHSATEAEIVSRIANVYWEADLPDEAEDAFRQVLKEFDKTPSGLNDLAGFLIETGRDVDNGLELIKEALNADPNQWYYLHTKGWGLFKLGKYDEALNTLHHAWDHSPLYDQNLYRHIKVVEKALASQNQ